MNKKTYSLMSLAPPRGKGIPHATVTSSVWVKEVCTWPEMKNNRRASWSSSVSLQTEEMLVITAICRQREGLCECAKSAFISVYSASFRVHWIWERNLVFNWFIYCHFLEWYRLFTLPDFEKTGHRLNAGCEERWKLLWKALNDTG